MKMVDPVCDMIVDVKEQRDLGLTLKRDDREYAFCAQGCLITFSKSPRKYIPKVEAWLAAGGSAGAGAAGPDETPALDEGMRRWYETCPCCLGERYPKAKAMLDAEKAAAARTS